MEMSATIGAIAKALSDFQGGVKGTGKHASNPLYNSKYATLDDCIGVIKDEAPKHGLSFIQSLSTVGEMSGICTLIMHESGEWIKTDVVYAPALQKRKNEGVEFNAQGVGSAGTYLRRYSLSAAFGLDSEEDDDGNSSGGRNVEMIKAVTLGQCKVLLEDIVGLGGERDKILSAIKVEVGTSLFEQMTKDQGQAIVQKMEQWKAKMVNAPKGDN